MTRCRGSPIKHRVSKPHGPHSHGAGKSDYAHGMKGHAWEGHGPERKCGNCGKKPNKGFTRICTEVNKTVKDDA